MKIVLLFFLFLFLSFPFSQSFSIEISTSLQSNENPNISIQLENEISEKNSNSNFIESSKNELFNSKSEENQNNLPLSGSTFHPRILTELRSINGLTRLCELHKDFNFHSNNHQIILKDELFNEMIHKKDFKPILSYCELEQNILCNFLQFQKRLKLEFLIRKNYNFKDLPKISGCLSHSIQFGNFYQLKPYVRSEIEKTFARALEGTDWFTVKK